MKLKGFTFWYQFEFEYETEYLGFLSALTQVQNSQAHRRALLKSQLVSFQEGFLTYFKPSVPPYDGSDEIVNLIKMEADAEEAEKICGGNQ